MRRASAVLVVALAATSVFAAEKLKKYSDPKSGFEVSVPAKWKQQKDDTVTALFVSADQAARLQILVDKTDASALELLAATEEGLGVKNIYTGAEQRMPKEQVQSAGADEGARGLFTLDPDSDHEVHLGLRIYKKGNASFAVQEIAPEDEALPDRMELFNQISATFKLGASGAAVAAEEPAPVADSAPSEDAFDKEFQKKMAEAQANAAGGAVDMDNMGKIGMYVAIGFFGLIALIVFPIALRFSRKGIKRARIFNNGPTNLGFTNEFGTFKGKVQGYEASVKPGFGADPTTIGDKGGMDAYQSAMAEAGEDEEFESPKFFHSFELKLEVPGANFPATALFDSAWWKRFGEGEQERRELSGEKLDVGAKGLEVFGADPAFAQRLLANPEFQLHAAKWPFLNLELNGDEVTLFLLNKWQDMEAKFGDGLWNWKFAEQGYALMIAAAKTK